MQRRSFLAGTAAAALAAPRLARAEAARVLKFVPYVDLAILDPIVNTASQTRTHAFLVFDTLFGLDFNYQVQPQMVEGVTRNADHTEWRLTLRDGLRFHDGTPVLARDCVASIRRWAVRDVMGQSLMAITDTLSAPSDKVIAFRLRQPFRLLAEALGKMAPTMPAMMPERLASLDPLKPVPELIGSGPFRFVAQERVPGALVVYEKFAGYVPRTDAPGFTSGPKIVHVDRVEWHTIAEGATAAGALQAGEVDWLEAPPPDLLPQLRRDKALVVETTDRTGVVPVLRFNCLQKPFDNPKLRRALLRAVDQTAFMQAFSGDTSLWEVKYGLFTPGTPMASDVGFDGLFGPTDVARGRREVAESGYAGEPVMLMEPTDHPVNNVMALVAADLFQKLGLTVQTVAMDAGTMFQRRANRGPLDKGGWSAFPSAVGGIDAMDPADAFLARGNGLQGWYGWPTIPELERLRAAWIAEEDLAKQKQICARMQLALFDAAPHLPLGHILQQTAHRTNITDIPPGFAKFWGVRKT
jgi:peptide/nickel transport system substrate-binding protein